MAPPVTIAFVATGVLPAVVCARNDALVITAVPAAAPELKLTVGAEV